MDQPFICTCHGIAFFCLEACQLLCMQLLPDLGYQALTPVISGLWGCVLNWIVKSFSDNLQEAGYICRWSNTNAVMTMTNTARDDLWQSIQAHDHKNYASVVESLFLTPTARAAQAPQIPIRLLMRAGKSGMPREHGCLGI